MRRVPKVRRVAGVPGVRRFLAIGVVLALAAVARPSAQQGQKPPDQPRFEGATSVTLVSVDVVVRDSKGEVVRGLTAKDFTVLEDGKPQRIDNFSFQEIAAAPADGKQDVQLLDGLEEKVRAEAAKAASATAPTPEPTAPAADVGTLNRRMLTIMFDVSSM